MAPEEERRRPLGGVAKETYIASGGHPLTYDLMAGMRSEVCEGLKSVKEDTKYLKRHGVEHCVICKADLERQFIRKAFKKWPVSIVELIFYVLIIGILIGTHTVSIERIFSFL